MNSLIMVRPENKRVADNIHPRVKLSIVGSLRDREVGARPQTARARISNPVSGGQCHLIHLTILRRFSWPSSAYMCTKVA